MRAGVFTVCQMKLSDANENKHRIYMGIIIEKTAIVMLWRCIFDLADISGVSIFKQTKCPQIYYFTVVNETFPPGQSARSK